MWSILEVGHLAIGLCKPTHLPSVVLPTSSRSYFFVCVLLLIDAVCVSYTLREGVVYFLLFLFVLHMQHRILLLWE